VVAYANGAFTEADEWISLLHPVRANDDVIGHGWQDPRILLDREDIAHLPLYVGLGRTIDDLSIEATHF
jgi:hypothetical protein